MIRQDSGESDFVVQNMIVWGRCEEEQKTTDCLVKNKHNLQRIIINWPI